MPKIGQIRGMLLEEALLHLLRGSGYRTVEGVNNAGNLGTPYLTQLPQVT